MATMTLIGLYNYDNTIFDKMVLPEQLDFETVKNSLIMTCAEFEPLYPSPDALKTAIEYWSKGKLHSWEKIATALYHEYDPFINFTRDERRETEYTPNLTDSRTPNLTDTRTPNLVNETNSNTETTNKIGAWNENELQTKDIQEINANASETQKGTETATHSGTDTTTHTGSARTVETFHSQGDSAMFTPTDVAKKETELRITFDLIEIIIDSFKNTLVLAVY